MGGKAVSEHMGRNVPGDAASAGLSLNAPPQRYRGKFLPSPVQKYRSRRLSLYQFWPAFPKINFKSLHAFSSNGDNPFFISFPNNVDESRLEVELLQTQLAQLA